MSQPPNLFISFSSGDQREVQNLFSALEIQSIRFWDYSDRGQELPPGHPLDTSLKAKIDACEYFIAVISPNSIDEQTGLHTRLEVRYAIDRGKAQRNRLLPLLLKEPSDQWLSLYGELRPLLHVPLDIAHPDRFEDTVRRICDWMSAPYVPSLLRDPRVFFAKLFLKEAEGKHLGNAEFVKLMRIMNSCARQLLDEGKEEKEIWAGVKAKINYFLEAADDLVPGVSFYYPLVMRGVAELQLGELAQAEQTFLRATQKQDPISNPLLSLGFAGLGSTYFSLGRYEEASSAYQKSTELQPDAYAQYNHLCALAQVVDPSLIEPMADALDLTELEAKDRLEVLKLKGLIKYRKGDYPAVVRIFQNWDWDDLDEASALYYSFALRECDADDRAINVLTFAADKLKTTNLYHQLADAHLKACRLEEALRIFEDVLCGTASHTDLGRQIWVEYARILRYTEGAGGDKVRAACEKVLDPTMFPPPQSKADFFFTGFAYYLLGREELARHYYDNSAGFSPEYYDEFEL